MKTTAAALRKAISKDMLVATLEADSSYDATVSEDGKTEAFILLHSRMGIRIEFNINKNTLALWLSPQAGKSVSYKDRNFSCRDDHTAIFDKISFPELGPKKFVRCDYDPFHCVLHFERQVMHIASLIDKPVVLVWTEKEEVIDFKSDKQDSLLTRSAAAFAVRHPDRGRIFDFVAALGKGPSKFLHQPETDQGRSTYARIILSPGQLLVIGGELSKEKVERLVTGVASKNIVSLLKNNEQQITKALLPGAAVLKNNPEMQKLYDINKRHLLSAQDASGAIRAALKYVYYLIWTTDGSVTSTSMFQTGWSEFLKLWLEYLLSNPTSQEAPPHGRFYGQLANGRITKREEFGSVCAVWAAFMHWGLTKDKRFVSGSFLRVLEDAVDWMEQYCWDTKVGAIGTYYNGGGSEDPFYGSNDFGYDAAVGSFGSRNCFAPKYKGELILRAFEFNMNLNQYNMYLMLYSVNEGTKAEQYLQKAKTVEKFLLKLLERNGLAFYLLDKKGMVLVENPEGSPQTGLLAIQSQSPAFYMPDFPIVYMNRQKSFKAYTEETIKGQMPCVAYGKLAGLDTEFVDEREIMRSLEVSLPYHIKPSKYNPMPYTMVEVMGAKDGEYHDIRPQAFSAGPFQAAVTNCAVRTMPFGIALRGTNFMSEFRHFEYLDGYLDIQYKGKGRIARVLLNGKPLEYTLQVPDDRMKSGANKVVVELSPDVPAVASLVYSTVRLSDVKSAGGKVRYTITGYCQNVLIFRDAAGNVAIRDPKGKPVKAVQTRIGHHQFFVFEGKGMYKAEIG